MGPRHASDGLAPGVAIRRALTAGAVAVLAAVGLIAAWHTLQDDEPVPTAFAPTASSPAPSPAQSSKSPKPATSPSRPATSPSPEPTATPDPTRSPKPKPRPSQTRERPDRSVDVVVLNGTYRTGLAASAAARLRSLGWQVVGVANWRGAPVRQTTLFTTLEPDQARRTLKEDVPQIAAVRLPLPSMSHGRFVIVLGPDYP